jgi:hypothetical protein
VAPEIPPLEGLGAWDYPMIDNYFLILSILIIDENIPY